GEVKEFQGHKAIFAAQSPVFDRMFTIDLEEKKLNRVEIIDIKPEVFKEFIKFIYTGKVGLDKRFDEDLLVVADKVWFIYLCSLLQYSVFLFQYQVDHLKALCEGSLITKLTPETVANYLVIADMHSAEQLKASAIEYINR